MADGGVLTSDSGFSGSVDLVTSERVYGWFKWTNGHSQRGWITVVSGGVTLRSGSADLFRPDLQLAGIGDGCHGFDFALAPGELRVDTPVYVYAAESKDAHGVLLGEAIEFDIPAAPQPLLLADTFDLPAPEIQKFPTYAELTRAIRPVLSNASSGVTALHIDVTDLLIYLSHHRHVSGIQRVQCGYIANMLRSEDPALSLQFCLQAHGVPVYVAVPADDIRDLMREMHAPDIASAQEWTSYIQHLMATDTKKSVAFQPDDILLVMGAPWIHPNYFAAIGNAKAEYGIRYFQIFYDLIPTFLPEHCDAGLVEAFNMAVAGMLRHADHLFSISDYSAADFGKLAERCGVAMPPMSVIPMGGTVDYEEESGTREALLACGPDRTLDRFFKAQKLDEYVLCVGTIESRKNHAYLYQVWKRLAELHGARTPKLVLVGRLGWHIEPLQRALKMSNWLDGKIVHLPEVSDMELRELYRRCLFTVFPSIYEGWGLPVGESLYYGKVPVTSGVTSMPEVGREWAVYIDPFNIEDGFRKIDTLLTDRPKLKRAESRIAHRYKPQTWNDAAAKFHRQITGLIHARPIAGAKAPDTTTLQLPGRYTIGDIVHRPLGLRAEDTVLHQLRVFQLRDILDGPDWYHVEAWGCWSQGVTARLSLNLAPAEARPSLCLLAVWLPGWYPATRCVATVNGRHAGRFLLPTLGEVGTLRLEIEAGDMIDGPVRIEITLDRLVAHPDPENGEKRSIGLGINSVFLCHKDDFESRLAYLEDRHRA